MEKISRDQIELLAQLQEKELEASKIDAILKKLPEKIEAMTMSLKKFEAAVDARKEALSNLKKTYRSFEMDMQSHQSRIKKREEQLRAVKTNKEYQAILAEIEEIKQLISKIEDETLACLDKMDASEKEVQAKVNEYMIEKENIEAGKASLEQEAALERKKLEQIVAERDRLCELVDPQLLKEYQFIKSIAGGLAIVEVKNSVCLGCNMNIPHQMYNELHRGNELRNCPHCHRLLYVI
jgi:predicted  nucleic acid-binding Zn-ribbon protein